MSILSQAQLSDSPLVDSITKGVPILDTVEEVGYFDQPHLTRSLEQFIGYTPAPIIRMDRPDYSDVPPRLPFYTRLVSRGRL